MSVRRLEVRKETYRDSITMLGISNKLARLDGVSQAAAVMATDLNKKVLRDIGFTGPEVEGARSDDMIIAIEAVDSDSLDKAFSEVDSLLNEKLNETGETKIPPKTLGLALEQMPEANMVIISVPGQFAKREALNAIERGLNVFLFSSNVSTEDEIELKSKAIARHLLMMGPDCGTSIINRTVLGFGNIVRSGPVGIVSASGTGLQQVSTLLDSAGVGISQAIGTGGNDLSDAVGGRMMTEGINLLNDDVQTKIIILISKPPGPNTTKSILDQAARCHKPVIVNFLGWQPDLRGANNCTSAETLEDTALMTCKKLGVELPADLVSESIDEQAIGKEWRRFNTTQKYVRGLYSGGTLCYEAQIVMLPYLGTIGSNAPLVKSMRIDGNAMNTHEHICIDMGTEEFVVGRAHPMMDYTLRKLRILKEAQDPEVAVFLLDIVLGYGSNSDPATELKPSIEEAKGIARDAGRSLSFVGSIVGTGQDPQNLDLQRRILADAGMLLFPSNAHAARAATLIAQRGDLRRRGGNS
jgi:FdrA protein